MATSSYDSVFSLYTQKKFIPVGATVAVYFNQIPGQNSVMLKYFSGGTCFVLGVTSGVTLSAASLAAEVDTNSQLNSYLVGASEILAIDGPATFYVYATGATVTLYTIAGRSQGQ